jgi:hypothetical protein
VTELNDLNLKSGVKRLGVVHVVRNAAEAVPPITHKPVTIRVDCGGLRSFELGQRAAHICECAGRRVAAQQIAKVGVAGSNPVFRSKVAGGGHFLGRRAMTSKLDGLLCLPRQRQFIKGKVCRG